MKLSELKKTVDQWIKESGKTDPELKFFTDNGIYYISYITAVIDIGSDDYKEIIINMNKKEFEDE